MSLLADSHHLLEKVFDCPGAEGWTFHHHAGSLLLSKQRLEITVTADPAGESLRLEAELSKSATSPTEAALLLNEAHVCQIRGDGIPGIDPEGRPSLVLLLDCQSLGHEKLVSIIADFAKRAEFIREKITPS